MMKTAIISGAGGALGGAVVKKFLESGYQVEAFYHSDLPSTGKQNFRSHQVDLLNEAVTKEKTKEIFGNQKTIDVLVCAAGGFAAGAIGKTSQSDLEKQYKLNFSTAYNLVKPVYDKMKAQGHGAIFLIGSRQGADSSKSTGTVAYGLSKSLLFHLAEILNADSEGTVVTSVVVPSTMDTEANRKSMPDADFSTWVSPEAIADIILFYCSDKAAPVREPVIKVYGNA